MSRRFSEGTQRKNAPWDEPKERFIPSFQLLFVRFVREKQTFGDFPLAFASQSKKISQAGAALRATQGLPKTEI